MFFFLWECQIISFRGNKGTRGSRGGSYGPRSRGGKWNNPEHGHHTNNYHNNHSGASNFPPPHLTAGPDTVPQPTPEEIVARHMHDRSLYLFALLTGKAVEVTTRSEETYQGLLHCCSTETDLSVVLKLASLKTAEADELDYSGDTIKTLVIMAKDIVNIAAVAVDLTPPISRTTSSNRSQGFATDTGISGHSGRVHERELEQWVPDPNLKLPNMTLEDTPNRFVDANGNWDQFAANENLFNVKSNYDELQYTTEIDRSAPDFEQKLEYAIKIEKEILSQRTTNTHIAEERGHYVDNHLDEEDKYSSVQRLDASGKYLSPALRAKLPKTDSPSKQQTPASAQSEASKGSESSQKASNTGSNPSSKGESQPSKPSEQPTSSTPAKKLTTSTPISQKKCDAIYQLFSSNSRSLSKPTQRKLYGDTKTKHIEEELMGTFRQFVSTEKERLLQTKQALSKKDKDGKFAELLHFSKTFKLKTPIPKDIKEIIHDKGESKPEPAVKEPPKLSSTKLNVTAPAFTPKFSAKPFTPSSTTASVEPATSVDSNSFFSRGMESLDENSGVQWLLEGAKSKAYSDPSTHAPTWPTIGKPYRQQFTATPVEPSYGSASQGAPQGPNFTPNSYANAYRYPHQMAYGNMPPMNIPPMSMPPQQMGYLGNPPPYGAYPNPPSHGGSPVVYHGQPSPGPSQTYYKQPGTNDNAPTTAPGSPSRGPAPPHQASMYGPPLTHSPMMVRYPPDMSPVPITHGQPGGQPGGVVMTPRPIMGDPHFHSHPHSRPMMPQHSGPQIPGQSNQYIAGSPHGMVPHTGPGFQSHGPHHPPQGHGPPHIHGSPMNHGYMPHYGVPPQHYNPHSSYSHHNSGRSSGKSKPPVSNSSQS